MFSSDDISERTKDETRKVIDRSWVLLRATGHLTAYKASPHLMRSRDGLKGPDWFQQKRRGSFSMIDPKADERSE
jgi:hypothetical protein